MEVRPCTLSDLALLRAGWPTVEDVHGAHLDEAAGGNATYLVAWRGDEPLGSALVQWRGPRGAAAARAHPDAVELNHLQVRAEHRGLGVGTRLVAAAEALARSRGRTVCALAVAADNPDAARLYERLGYRRTGIVDVCEYDWTDESGRVHHEVEHDELLIKHV